jgi:hypothetical protein
MISDGTARHGMADLVITGTYLLQADRAAARAGVLRAGTLMSCPRLSAHEAFFDCWPCVYDA